MNDIREDLRRKSSEDGPPDAVDKQRNFVQRGKQDAKQQLCPLHLCSPVLSLLSTFVRSRLDTLRGEISCLIESPFFCHSLSFPFLSAFVSDF